MRDEPAWQTPPMQRPFSQVDVFTSIPYRGNNSGGDFANLIITPA
jgi:hypothetical protein